MKDAWTEPLEGARRVGILRLSARVLVDMCKPGVKHFEVTENALPQDAKATGGWYDSYLDIFELAVESEIFPLVIKGSEPPTLPAVGITDLRYTAKEA